MTFIPQGKTKEENFDFLCQAGGSIIDEKLGIAPDESEEVWERLKEKLEREKCNPQAGKEDV